MPRSLPLLAVSVIGGQWVTYRSPWRARGLGGLRCALLVPLVATSGNCKKLISCVVAVQSCFQSPWVTLSCHCCQHWAKRNAIHRIMLGQGCFRAIFWRTIYFHLMWVSNGFLLIFWNGFKSGRKVVFWVQKWVKMGPKPTLYPLWTRLGK